MILQNNFSQEKKRKLLSGRWISPVLRGHYQWLLLGVTFFCPAIWELKSLVLLTQLPQIWVELRPEQWLPPGLLYVWPWGGKELSFYFLIGLIEDARCEWNQDRFLPFGVVSGSEHKRWGLRSRPCRHDQRCQRVWATLGEDLALITKVYTSEGNLFPLANNTVHAVHHF